MASVDDKTIEKYLNTSIELFDEKKLHKTAGNSIYKIKTLADGFEGTSTRILKDIERFLEKSDFKKIVESCNDLILIASDVGGNRLFLAVENIKTAAKNSEGTQISNLIVIVKAEIEKLSGELKNFLENMKE